MIKSHIAAQLHHPPPEHDPQSIADKTGSRRQQVKTQPMHLVNGIHIDNAGQSQAARVPGLHGSSRGACSNHFCKPQASPWPFPECASRLSPRLPPLPWLRPVAADVREPWVALLELLGFGDGLSGPFAFGFVRAGLFAWETCSSGKISHV